MALKRTAKHLRKSYLFTKLNKYKVITSIFFITTSTSVLFYFFTNISMPLELGLYDLNFLFRPAETVDENIIIVEWNNEDTILQNENVMSDSTFLKLLTKILEQRPRVVGMNIHREILKYSPRLSAEQNVTDHQSLKKAYQYVNNLFVVQKIIEPLIQAPDEIVNRKQNAASDIPASLITRTSYIYPVLNKKEGSLEEKGLPYIGAKLAFEFLKKEGYTIEENYEDKKNLSVVIKNEENAKSNIVKPYSDGFDLSVKDMVESFEIFINWRKGEKHSKVFKTISVSNVLKNQTPEQFFYNKVVLIGNTSEKIEQRYVTPLSKWENSKIHPVEIAAHLASSLINNVLENRPLVNPVSKYINILLIIIPGLTYGGFMYIYRHNNLPTVLFLSSIYVFIVSILLILINFVGLYKGIWLLVSLPIINIWILYLRSNYLNFKQAENMRIENLELFAADFEHSISGPINSIASSMYRISTILENINANSYSTKKITKALTVNPKDFSKIYEKNNNISTQIKILQRYRVKTRQYILVNIRNNPETFFKSNPKNNIVINLFIKETIDKIISEIDELNEINYDKHLISIEYSFDSKLKRAKINKPLIKIVLENLVKNAVFAVDPQCQSRIYKPHFIPTIKITTKSLKNKYQFSIGDNGVGINKKLIENIFEPFTSYRTKYVYSGQGIGLNLTKRIILLHGGKIDLDTEENMGSNFTITLPR